MTRAVLLDDEAHCNDSLARMLELYFPRIQVVGIFSRPGDFLLFTKNETFDLLFLDIKMPGITGFQLLEKLDNIDFHVVFVTAFDNFAIKAIRYAAFDYLLKPVVKTEVDETLKRFENRLLLNYPRDTLKSLSKPINTPEMGQRLVIPSVTGYEFINQKDIIRCEADRNYCLIETSERTIICSKPLKDIEDLLHPSWFIRIHNSHIVNKSAVRKFIKSDGGFLELFNGQQLPVARLRKEYVLEELYRG